MHVPPELPAGSDFPPINRTRPATLQVNLGYTCNQHCVHCHVDAGPQRTEQMDEATVDLLLQVLESGRFATLDITGGAPELNRAFRRLVVAARKLGLQVVDRCNLTVLFEPGQEDTAEFLADNAVEIAASLPWYEAQEVDAQRGAGVFEQSMMALGLLNALGYGQPKSGLVLNLVHNPQGPALPPGQKQLAADYRRELGDEQGIVFNQLFTLANMPIQRFASTLAKTGELGPYMAQLRSSHQPANLEKVMCRTLVSVDWQGWLYDCDFNQMLGLPAQIEGKPRLHLRDLLHTELDGLPITVGSHCYGCTAGQGSSFGGALTGLKQAG